jgi:hypothetical protein
MYRARKTEASNFVSRCEKQESNLRTPMGTNLESIPFFRFRVLHLLGSRYGYQKSIISSKNMLDFMVITFFNIRDSDVKTKVPVGALCLDVQGA